MLARARRSGREGWNRRREQQGPRQRPCRVGSRRTGDGGVAPMSPACSGLFCTLHVPTKPPQGVAAMAWFGLPRPEKNPGSFSGRFPGKPQGGSREEKTNNTMCCHTAATGGSQSSIPWRSPGTGTEDPLEGSPETRMVGLHLPPPCPSWVRAVSGDTSSSHSGRPCVQLRPLPQTKGHPTHSEQTLALGSTDMPRLYHWALAVCVISLTPVCR